MRAGFWLLTVALDLPMMVEVVRTLGTECLLLVRVLLLARVLLVRLLLLRLRERCRRASSAVGW